MSNIEYRRVSYQESVVLFQMECISMYIYVHIYETIYMGKGFSLLSQLLNCSQHDCASDSSKKRDCNCNRSLDID